MFGLLMDEIKNGGSLEVNQLARKLNTTPQMVEVMMEHLQRNGVVKPYEACSDACSGCQLSTACSHKQGSRVTQIWQFEEKRIKKINTKTS